MLFRRLARRLDDTDNKRTHGSLLPSRLMSSSAHQRASSAQRETSFDWAPPPAARRPHAGQQKQVTLEYSLMYWR
ncbi:hypothetical protein EYF80_062616 [Liparis tanakae]|uniref:Uncharacterized protein n=1 Tax=Liparis tanakae TaxID=230148 RepID=A0A4Z2EFC3_9TELE|nr:hypothetical protein EYF80_062616 [Liparis tanakae]